MQIYVRENRRGNQEWADNPETLATLDTQDTRQRQTKPKKKKKHNTEI